MVTSQEMDAEVAEREVQEVITAGGGGGGGGGGVDGVQGGVGQVWLTGEQWKNKFILGELLAMGGHHTHTPPPPPPPHTHTHTHTHTPLAAISTRAASWSPIVVKAHTSITYGSSMSCLVIMYSNTSSPNTTCAICSIPL